MINISEDDTTAIAFTERELAELYTILSRCTGSIYYEYQMIKSALTHGFGWTIDQLAELDKAGKPLVVIDYHGVERTVEDCVTNKHKEGRLSRLLKEIDEKWAEINSL